MAAAREIDVDRTARVARRDVASHGRSGTERKKARDWTIPAGGAHRRRSCRNVLDVRCRIESGADGDLGRDAIEGALLVPEKWRDGHLLSADRFDSDRDPESFDPSSRAALRIPAAAEHSGAGDVRHVRG